MYSQPRGRLLATRLTQATVSGLNDRVIVSGKPDYLFFARPASHFANLITIILRDKVRYEYSRNTANSLCQ